MLHRFVGPAVLKADASIFAEGHQVGQQEAVARLNLVIFLLRGLEAGGANRVTGEGQGHVAPAPIVSAAAPFLSAGALRLRGEAVVKVEAWVALQAKSAAVHQVGVSHIQQCRVQRAIGQHRADVLGGRDVLERHTGRRLRIGEVPSAK